ncbi:periplasmic chaperone for outer membrane proteins Skp [Roseovarius litoreus]|jgi:Skp family chaperone for outer membrane proteins|uniref:Periplasmic chaperone for outer membrane proteins Skp n=1 Tax=Roseovarius litoreus TaxID=1155722 RepID=A0A1M7H4S3_9RHOB|nr:OmpH family outer membrane protein [Roseovarius litoreus]SHM23388.1 periplasmic chaperone for outer membrane proteins Skp [Roseovarius litoreus]
MTGLAFLRRVAVSVGLGITMLAGVQASAQSIGVVQSDVLVVNPDLLFAETRLGQRMTDELQTERDALIALNRDLEQQLESEEKALTELRAETSPEEFRRMADSFDQKVQQIREDSERRVRDLERSRSQAPVTFMRIVEPILIEIMRDADAAVILDSRATLLSVDAVDITALAISRVDETIGDTMPPELMRGPQAAPDDTSSGAQ